MKNFKSIALISSLILSSGVGSLKAEDINLVAIAKPAILDEGTQRELSAAQIAELLPWAKDSKNFLTDLLDNVQGLTTTDKVERLIEGIKSSVIESAPKNSELLMRYALNRAIVINDILDREMDASAVGTIDAKSRVLILSIKMALKYYDADMDTLSKKTASPFASFGIEYFNFLTEVNKSIFDASAQYNIQRTSLEWLQWDLYRDLNNATYASQILKINNALKTFPTRKISDAQSISYIRQMKKVSEQLNVVEKKEEDSNSSQTVIFGSSNNSNSSSSNSSSSRSNFRYSGSSCWATSAKGDLMYSVSDSNCASGNYIYSGSSCWATSTSHDLMHSVSDSNCASGNYRYSGTSCWATSKSGDLMHSVSDSNCASGNYRYSGSSCWATSKSGDLMHSVNNSNCR